MKIAIISPSSQHLQDMGDALEGKGHQVSLTVGGKSRMAGLAQEDAPDVMLVDGMCCDPAELAQVEHVTSRHPRIAVILLCATQTPEFLINSMRVGVREVLPSPATADALLPAIARVQARLKGQQSPAAGKVLAFIACKGGSGATFLATNLGAQLSENRSVLLIDLNLQFGDALSFVHDGRPASTIADIAHDIRRLDASFLAVTAVKVAPNFHILAAPEDLSQAMEVKPEHVDTIINLAATQYDFVLLDLSRTLDTLNIKALDRADRIFPVLQANLPSVRNANKLLGVFKSLGYAAAKVELVLNRFEKTGDIGLEEIQRSLGVAALRTVPNAFKEVNGSINEGNALPQTRSSPVTRSLADFAMTLNPQESEEVRGGILGRLFRRA
ncbi:MAG: AAA family ATPase [Pseudomonadota bacterium]